MANKIMHTVERNLRKGSCTEKTKQDYRRYCEAFERWVIETKGSKRLKVKLYQETVQEYIEHLEARGLSPHTIHTYASGVTQGLGMSLDDIAIPKRGRSSKGRTQPYNADTGKASDLCRRIGIRRQEYRRLKGGHLVEEDGITCVVVDKGKGGKPQKQVILPAHVEAVKAAFRGVKDGDFLFTKEQLKSLEHANTHAARREVAREAYGYYMGLDKAERGKYLELCHQRYLSKYDKACAGDPGKSRARGEQAWRRQMDMIRRQPVWHCRGANKEELIRQGRKPCFDRECALIVSVLHLSHYRISVTVNNYLI